MANAPEKGADDTAEKKPARKRAGSSQAKQPAKAATKAAPKKAAVKAADKTAPAKAATKAAPKKAADKTAPAKTAARKQSGNGLSRELPRLLESYRSEIHPVLVREFGYTNPMQAPRLMKIVLNIGMGEALTSSSALAAAMSDIGIITGQKPRENKAKKSIANYKLREGQVIGTSVTMRGDRMWHFYDRLVNIALPRVRDFRGIPRDAFDGRGNYTLGMRDQAVFAEIDYNDIDRLRGMQVILVTSARTDEEGRRLLELLGMPFVRLETAAAS